MTRIAKITDAYVRHYRDNCTHVAYVEWIDTRGRAGRTQGQADPDCTPCNTHMAALFARATREGVVTRFECW